MDKFSIRLPSEFKGVAVQVATERHITLSNLMHDALVGYLDVICPGLVTDAMRVHPVRGEANRIKPPVSEEAGRIGVEIKRRRKLHGLSQEQLALKADVPRYVAELAECATVEFDPETINQILSVIPDRVPAPV